jgi:hypothetical protein
MKWDSKKSGYISWGPGDPNICNTETAVEINRASGIMRTFSPTQTHEFMCEKAVYPEIKIVDVDSSTVTLANLKTRCGSGYRIVSIKNAAHVMWLSDQVEQLKGKNLFDSE